VLKAAGAALAAAAEAVVAEPAASPVVVPGVAAGLVRAAPAKADLVRRRRAMK
jgi:hypothetical protein